MMHEEDDEFTLALRNAEELIEAVQRATKPVIRFFREPGIEVDVPTRFFIPTPLFDMTSMTSEQRDGYVMPRC